MKLHSFKGLDLSFFDAERRRIVFDNLNAAKDGGYYDDLPSNPADMIVFELMSFAEDCQHFSPAQLKPHVEAWIKEQQ